MRNTHIVEQEQHGITEGKQLIYVSVVFTIQSLFKRFQRARANHLQVVFRVLFEP